MNLKVRLALSSYISLPPEDKEEFIQELLKHHKVDVKEVISLEALGSTINEAMITLGPREGRCGVCGRG